MSFASSNLGNAVSTTQLQALQDEFKSILPPSAPPEALLRLTAAAFRASQLSITALHQEKRCKDEIWHIFRAASVNPSENQLDRIFELIYQLNRSNSNELSHLRINRYDDRLSSWNDEATAFFEQMALTSGAGKRVHEQRPSAASASSAPSSHTTQPVSSSHAHTSNLGSASASSFEPSWLRLRCTKLQIVRDGGLPAHEMAASVLTLLAEKSITDDQIQGDLFDAFAGDFDAVTEVLLRRADIAKNADAILADCSQAHEISEQGLSTSDAVRGRGVRGRNSRNDRAAISLGGQITVRDSRQQARQKKQAKEMRRLVKAGLIMEEEPDEEDDFAVQDLGGSQFEERAKAFGTDTDRDVALGTVERVTLPRGSTREVGKGYEEIFVPPPQRQPLNDDELIDIPTALRGHPELLRAMRGVKRLNRLQSAVYPMAFKSNENILVCAPTGAGKTNVALLTIFREIIAVKEREKRAFKVVYVAPMKALAAEVTEKFHQRLGPLGLRVREFTGDMSLSRVEALDTHVLVTTPEKWDVVTRKSGSELGDMVTLFIVDEIHLLHDERGAVLESIVARTLRLSETAQKEIRLVGLSATLPNYADVGAFMKVDPSKGLFYFDGSHRPVPLSQTFIGVSEGSNSNTHEARRRRDAKMQELAWKKVKDSLQRGHQAMIFVHSRKGTTSAAREMISRASQDDVENIFFGTGEDESRDPNQSQKEAEEDEEESFMPPWATREIAKSRTSDIRELCAKGVGIHNAGLPRSDRKLVEKLFADGIIRLLCCTATLAWGVNLPARTVVIMGTEVYSAEKGGFVQLGVLDVTQIFGRAGRPQFDTEGEGTIITEHDHLAKYLSMLTSSIPIESQLGASASRMADHLNAEVVSGTVSSIGDGVRWLNYTYLSVRMPQNPLVYGIEWEEVEADGELHSRKAKLVDQAARALEDAGMCRFDVPTGMISPNDLGRVASHFYVSQETIMKWNEVFKGSEVKPAIDENDWMRMYSIAIHAVSCATEFEQMRSRQDEADELEILTRNHCPVPLKSGSETREGKVSILLQAHISRANVRMSDLSYIVQSATRLLRGLFEVALRQSKSSIALAALELARASESRIWPFQHPLWQFTYLARRDKGILINPETIANIESGGEKHDLLALRSMTRDELAVLIRAPKIANNVQKALKSIPTLEVVRSRIVPLTATVFEIELNICVTFNWVDALHGRAESWWLWIDDMNEGRVYHHQKLLLTKKQVQSLNEEMFTGTEGRATRTLDLKFSVAVFNPPFAQYWARIESDRWHSGDRVSTVLTVANMELPKESKFKSEPCRMPPVSVISSLPPQEAALYSGFSRFNALQTQLLKLCRHGTDNIFVSAPSGSGKLTLAELGILNSFQNKRGMCVVFITSEIGTVELLKTKWRDLAKLGTGPLRTISSENIGMGISSLRGASVVVTTASSWNELMGRCSMQDICATVSLFVLHDIHLMSLPKNSGMELLVSYIRRCRQEASTPNPVHDTLPIPRIIALGSRVPNSHEIADWLGVSRQKGLLALPLEGRQVQRESHIIRVAGDRYASRMHAMNLPLFASIQRYSMKKPVLVYVSSKRQTILTCQDLLRVASLHGKKDMFVMPAKSGSLSSPNSIRGINDQGLKKAIPQGIGFYHSGLSSSELELVERLFRNGELHVLIATFDMARRLDAQAHQVILKGTEVFDTRNRRFNDLSLTDVRFMAGQAGRPNIDTTCYAVIFVQEPRQSLFKRVFFESVPAESSLLEGDFVETLLREIVAGRVTRRKDIMEWLLNTFFFKRLSTNPGYYGLKKKSGMSKKGKEMSSAERKVMQAERRQKFCEELISTTVDKLKSSACIEVGSDQNGSGNAELRATRLGSICSRANILTASTRLLFDKSNDVQSFDDVVDIVCRTTEVGEMSQEYDEETVWQNLFERVVKQFTLLRKFSNVELAAKGLRLVGWQDSAQKRTKLLLYSFVIDETGRVDEVFNRMRAFETFRKVVMAGTEVCAERGSLQAVKEFVRVGQSIAQGRMVTDNFWEMSGFSGTKVCETASAVGFVSVMDVLQAEREFGTVLAKHCDEAERGSIRRWVGSYPRIEQVVVERGGSNGSVCVSVCGRQMGNATRFVDAASRGAMSGQAGLVVVVWSELTGKVVGLGRMTERENGSSDEDGRRWMRTEVGVRGGDSSRARVWAASDAWIGVEGEGSVARSVEQVVAK